MNKFSILNESHNTVEKSTTIDEVIINLVKETLNYKINETNKDNILKLVESIKVLIEIQKSKKSIDLLENVRINSIRHFDLNWLNAVIDQEKEILENNNYDAILEQSKNFDIKDYIETSIIVNESVNCKNCDVNDPNCECIEDDKEKVEVEDDTENFGDDQFGIDDDDDLDDNDIDDSEEEFNDKFLNSDIKKYQDDDTIEESNSDKNLTKDDTFIDVEEDDDEDIEEDDEFESDIEEYETPEEEKNENKREKIKRFDEFKL